VELTKTRRDRGTLGGECGGLALLLAVSPLVACAAILGIGDLPGDRPDADGGRVADATSQPNIETVPPGTLFFEGMEDGGGCGSFGTSSATLEKVSEVAFRGAASCKVCVQKEGTAGTTTSIRVSGARGSYLLQAHVRSDSEDGGTSYLGISAKFDGGYVGTEATAPLGPLHGTWENPQLQRRMDIPYDELFIDVMATAKTGYCFYIDDVTLSFTPE
jgi:hypothetical protein